MDLIHKCRYSAYYAFGTIQVFFFYFFETIQVKKWKHLAILLTQTENSKLTMHHGKFVKLKFLNTNIISYVHVLHKH